MREKQLLLTERERKRVCECELERECRGGFYKEKKSTVSCWCCSSSRFTLLEKSLACCFLSFDDDNGDGVDGSCWGRLTAEAGSGRGVQEAAGALLLGADVHSFLAFRSSAVVVVVAVAVAAAAAGETFLR